MRGKNLESNWGYIKADSPFLNAVSNFTPAARFLWRTFEEYVQFNVHFCKTVNGFDPPVFYGEIQNQAILYLSMSNSCRKGEVPFPEHPFEHKHYKYAPEKRRIDYWAMLNNNEYGSALLVEYQHEKAYLKQKWHTKTDSRFKGMEVICRHWAKDVAKLRNIKETRILQDLSSWDGKNRQVIKINVMIIPILQYSGDLQNVNKVSRNNFISLIKEFKDKLKPEPNWQSYWWLDKEETWVQKGRKYWTNYPGAYMFAYLE